MQVILEHKHEKAGSLSVTISVFISLMMCMFELLAKHLHMGHFKNSNVDCMTCQKALAYFFGKGKIKLSLR